MSRPREWVGNTGEVRGRLISASDVRDDVAFQNDVNMLLSAMADLGAPAPKLPHGIEAPFGLLPESAEPPPAPPAPHGTLGRARLALADLAKRRSKRKATPRPDPR